MPFFCSKPIHCPSAIAPNFEKAKEIYTKHNMQQFLKENSPTGLRISAACEFFVNHAQDKGWQLLQEAKKIAAESLNKGMAVMRQGCLSTFETLFTSSAKGG